MGKEVKQDTDVNRQLGFVQLLCVLVCVSMTGVQVFVFDCICF